MLGHEGSILDYGPPILNGTNYLEWKIKMEWFMRATNGDIWRSILTGYNPPTCHVDAFHWTEEELQMARHNWTALDLIFDRVDLSQFSLISHCTTAKEAWDILEASNQLSEEARLAKLQLLATRFEKLKMDKKETIRSFYGRLSGIACEASLLGENYSEKELVMKFVTSLPKRFAFKVAKIEEVVGDVTTLTLGQLIGFFV